MASSFDKYDAEFVALRQLTARKHEHFPEWTWEQCAHAAVEELFDPELEPNPGFKAVLVARLRNDRSKKPRNPEGQDPPGKQ